MSAQIFESRAVEFLTKPFRDQGYAPMRLGQALYRDRIARDQRAALEELRSRFCIAHPAEKEK